MNIAEIKSYYAKAKKLSNKKELSHSKPPFITLLKILLESIKKNEELIKLIEDDLLHELPKEQRLIAVNKLSELDGF